ncbi:MAG: hypothetical protein DI551_11370 [Micavibrio aeruginosavorus]|uniref:EF-hand domain-containing protein n=1 Tax=Micavibrio aeruginosavorus TaxID=349221 RepID=A0A2W5MRF6_9BACT|nr:MAG: hypothetical protein DI551_11370 [Micavibrio aeruginosavorus]
MRGFFVSGMIHFSPFSSHGCNHIALFFCYSSPSKERRRIIMKKYAILTLTAAAALAVSLSSASAEGYTSKNPEKSSHTAIEFRKLDADKSGTLNRSEFEKMTDAAGSFKTLDSNRDNELTLSELQVAPDAATPASKASQGTSANTTGGTSGAGTYTGGSDDSGSGNTGRQ